MTSEGDRILVPSHKQMLEALPAAQALPAPPTSEQVRAQPRSRHAADSDDDMEEEEPEDKAVEAEASGLALRFPRRLRLTGLGFPDAKRAVAAAGKGAAAVEVAGAHLLEACSERPPSGKRRPRKDASRDLRAVAQEEVLRRVGGLSSEEFCFCGIFMRMHLGLPVWVASYASFGQRRSPPGRDDWRLEIILLRAPGVTEDRVLFEVFPSNPSMARDSRSKAPLPAGALSQARFYFDGDRDIIPSQWKNRCVLRGQAQSLDLLFRAPSSVPAFCLRSPKPQAVQVEFAFERSHAGQDTAGHIYQSVRFDGPVAGYFPELLRVLDAGGAENLAGTYRRCTSRYGDRVYREGDQVYHVRPGDEDASRPPARVGRGTGGVRQESRPLRLSECLQELNGFPMEYDSDTEISNASDDDDSDMGPSTDSDAGVDSDNDMGAWVFYFCQERQLILCPLIEDSFESDEEDNPDYNPGKTSARWAFARYLGSPGAGPAGSSGPPELVLTDVELQRALAQSIAWADIPGTLDLMGKFEVALHTWAPVPSCAIAPAFSREDEAAREVVRPRQPLTYDRQAASSSQDTAPAQDITVLQEVRCQLLRGTLALRGRKAGKGPTSGAGAANRQVSRLRGPPDIRKDLPLGQWVALDQVRFAANRGLAELRREMYDDIFQHPAAGNGQDIGAYLGMPGPAYTLRLREIPPAAAEWVKFGGDDVAALAQEVRQKAISLAAEKTTSAGKMAQEPQAFSLEVCRSAGAALDFRVCARPGVLLAALLSTDRTYPALEPGSVQLRFEWRLESKAKECAAELEPATRSEVLGAPAEAGPPGSQADGQGSSGASSSNQAPTPAPGAPGTGQGAGQGAGRAPNGPLFTLLSNLEDPEQPQPACFRDFPLRPEQLRTMHWMRSVEETDKPFVFDHEAVDDFSMDSCAWKLCGRLRRAVKVRGGVLADKVGYGKTATTIGLVQSTLSEGAPEPVGGSYARIPSRATLVLCPVNLQAQWVREVQKFVAGGLKVVSLQTYAQVKSVSVQDLANADLVIATYKLFHSAPYLARLRALALELGEPGPGAPKRRGVKGQADRAALAKAVAKAERRFARDEAEGGPNGRPVRSGRPPLPSLSWPPRNLGQDSGLWTADSRKKRALKSFEQEYAQLIAKLEAAGPTAAVLEAEGKKAAPRPRLEEAAAPESPKKRRRLSKGPPQACPATPERPSPPSEACRWGSRRAQGRKREDAQGGSSPWRKGALQGAVPLELFHWKRVVLDEFHELLTGHPPAQVAVRFLKARYRWGLSGTLPCKTPQDVVKTASFFNVHLNSSRRYTKAPAALCQRWLDHCVRRNTVGLPELRSEEAIVPVRQHPAERALYLQLTQATSDADLAGEEDAGTLLALRRRGREGLVKLCSHFQLTGGQLARSATDECDAVLQRRYRELAASRHVVKKTLEEAIRAGGGASCQRRPSRFYVFEGGTQSKRPRECASACPKRGLVRPRFATPSRGLGSRRAAAAPPRALRGRARWPHGRPDQGASATRVLGARARVAGSDLGSRWTRGSRFPMRFQIDVSGSWLRFPQVFCQEPAVWMYGRFAQ